MHERNTRFLLDTNVFIAAAKRGWTKTTELVIRLITGQEDLLADEALIGEYSKYAADLGNCSQLLLGYLLQKVIVLELSDEDSQLPRPEGRSLPLRKKSRGVWVADSSC